MSDKKDDLFASYGSDKTVILNSGSPLTQEMIEDAARAAIESFGRCCGVTEPHLAHPNWEKQEIAFCLNCGHVLKGMDKINEIFRKSKK